MTSRGYALELDNYLKMQTDYKQFAVGLFA
jgi:hypothetical protein